MILLARSIPTGWAMATVMVSLVGLALIIQVTSTTPWLSTLALGLFFIATVTLVATIQRQAANKATNDRSTT